MTFLMVGPTATMGVDRADRRSRRCPRRHGVGAPVGRRRPGDRTSDPTSRTAPNSSPSRIRSSRRASRFRSTPRVTSITPAQQERVDVIVLSNVGWVPKRLLGTRGGDRGSPRTLHPRRFRHRHRFPPRDVTPVTATQRTTPVTIATRGLCGMRVLDQLGDWFWRRFRNHYFLAISVMGVTSLCAVVAVPAGVHRRADLRASAAASRLPGRRWLCSAACWRPARHRHQPRHPSPDQRVDRGDHDHAHEAPRRRPHHGGVDGDARWRARRAVHAIVVAPIGRLRRFGLLGYIAVEAMGMVALSLAAFLMANGLRILTAPLLVGSGGRHARRRATAATHVEPRTLFGVGMYLVGMADRGDRGVSPILRRTHEHAAVRRRRRRRRDRRVRDAAQPLRRRRADARPARRPGAGHRTRRAGDFSRTIPVTSTDEFGELALSRSTR